MTQTRARPSPTSMRYRKICFKQYSYFANFDLELNMLVESSNSGTYLIRNMLFLIDFVKPIYIINLYVQSKNQDVSKADDRNSLSIVHSNQLASAV